MATTTYYLSPISLFLQIFSNIGVPLQGGYLYTYVAGTTSTPVTTYTDSTGTTQNANPIVLSSAGRMVAAGTGAPVAVWVPEGTAHKLLITDSAGNFILSLDNLTAINDPATVLSLLSSVSTSSVLGGADLIANAMRSYDVFSSVRAAAAPSLVSGQTLIIDVEGATVPGDGLGGFFYWSSTSIATDDGITCLKPTATALTSFGRYLRQPNTGYSGTLVMSFTGFSSTLSVTCVYSIMNNLVTIRVPQVNGTSNSTSFGFSFTNPSVTANGGGLYPSEPQWFPLAAAEDNGAGVYGTVGNIAGGTSGTIAGSFYKGGSASGWTATGTKGLSDGTAGQLSVNIQYVTN